MSLTQWITSELHQYTYQPERVYLLVVVIMVLAGFGLPIPEEFVVITTSMLAFMALHPESYPPPEPGARGVNVYILMLVCFCSVFLSDLLVFQIGRRLGRGMGERKWFQKIVNPKAFKKVKFWTQKYGSAAAGLFRFLPGLRFPGHLACGALGIPAWKFIMIDGGLVLLTIPTQVYLISNYGEEILIFMDRFKYVLMVIAILAILYIIRTILTNIKYVAQKSKLRAEKKMHMSK